MQRGQAREINLHAVVPSRRPRTFSIQILLMYMLRLASVRSAVHGRFQEERGHAGELCHIRECAIRGHDVEVRLALQQVEGHSQVQTVQRPQPQTLAQSILLEQEDTRLEEALAHGLKRLDPERTLYLAVSEATHHDIFEEPIGQLLLANGRLRLLVFTTKDEVIDRWTPGPPTAR
jgi:XisH protein